MEFFYKNSLGFKFLTRPWYGYNLYQAAKLAEKLSISEISVLEFGVAAGNGLLSIESHVRKIEGFTKVRFQVYGFDTATGLPALEGYKDLKHNWQEGQFTMDKEALLKKLERSKLVLGNVSETCSNFFETYKPAPVGCILFDLDLYSSTAQALKILTHDPSFFLPRVRCYFDDILGNETSLSNDFLGERLAINEFNQLHSEVKVVPVQHLLAKSFRYKWYHKCYAAHFFKHPDYETFLNG